MVMDCLATSLAGDLLLISELQSMRMGAHAVDTAREYFVWHRPNRVNGTTTAVAFGI